MRKLILFPILFLGLMMTSFAQEAIAEKANCSKVCDVKACTAADIEACLKTCTPEQLAACMTKCGKSSLSDNSKEMGATLANYIPSLAIPATTVSLKSPKTSSSCKPALGCCKKSPSSTASLAEVRKI